MALQREADVPRGAVGQAVQATVRPSAMTATISARLASAAWKRSMSPCSAPRSSRARILIVEREPCSASTTGMVARQLTQRTRRRSATGDETPPTPAGCRELTPAAAERAGSPPPE
jgi:hypothetical protein